MAKKLLLLACLCCVFTFGATFQLCSLAGLEVCEDNYWYIDFKNEAWFSSVGYHMLTMPPSAIPGWSSKFEVAWSTCLKHVLEDCPSSAELMKATILRGNRTQAHFSSSANAPEYEHYWRCLNRSDTAAMLTVCHSQHINNTENSCQPFTQAIQCVLDTTRLMCGEEAANYTTTAYHTYYSATKSIKYSCQVAGYTPPSKACDWPGATACMEDERLHWNTNNGYPDCTKYDQRMAKAHGCVFEHLYNCDNSVKLSFYSTDLYKLMTLMMNYTLHTCTATLSADNSVACSQYTNITLDKRAHQYIKSEADNPICDTEIDQEVVLNPYQTTWKYNRITQSYNSGKWYRFYEYTGEEIPEDPVSINHCGTDFPVWMQGKHPRVADLPTDYNYAIPVYVCITVGSDTCFFKYKIRVRNCRENDQTKNFVYNLRKLPTCEMSYCAGGIRAPCQSNFKWNWAINQCKHKDCTPQQDWNPQISRCLITGSSPNMTSTPSIQTPYVENGIVKVKCSITYEQQAIDDGARFIVSWYINSQDAGIPSVVTTSVAPYGILDEQYIQAKKSISCSVKSYWLGWEQHISTTLHSTPYMIEIKSPSSIVVDEADDQPTVLTFTSSVPFPCSSTNCVQLHVSGSANITLEKCTYDLSSSNQFQLKLHAEKTGTLRVQPYTTTINFKPLITTSQSSLWYNYQIPDISVQIIDNKKLGMCSVIGNTVQTFDGTQYSSYQPGQYKLFHASTAEVHMRSHNNSNNVSCVCGVAIHVRGFIHGIDFCNIAQIAPYIFSRSHYSVRNDSDGTINYLDNSGKSFEINTSYGKFATVFLQDNEHCMDVYLYAPPEYYNKVSGLCGSWDGSGENDVNGSIVTFVESKRIQQSLVNTTYIPNCMPEPQTPYCECTLSLRQCREKNDNKVTANDLGSYCATRKRSLAHQRHKRSTPVYAYQYNSFNINLNATFVWPTKSGIQEFDAILACQTALQGSASFQTCQNIVNMSSILHLCKEQIKISDNLTATSSAINALQQYCIFELETNITVGSTQQLGSTQTLNNVKATVCPAQCSGHGTCNNGECTCDTGYTGSDCGLPAGQAPRIWALEQRVLDVKEKLWDNIRVFGYGFWKSVNLRCKMKNVTLNEEGKHIVDETELVVSASLNSAYEIICEVPITPVTVSFPGGIRTTEHGFQLSVTTDGTVYSEEIMFVVYDSACRSCQANGVCVTKSDACQYDGICQSGSTCKDPCINNVNIGNPKRSTAYNVNNQSNPTVICDQIGIGNGIWYKFDQYTGSQIPETCVQPYHCATHSPIWFNGTHPTAQNPGPVSAQVCGNKLSSQSPDTSCCEWTETIQVKYCGLASGEYYHVYQLKAVPVCEMAYCSGSGTPCGDGHEFNTKTQTCQERNECLSNPCQNNGNCTDHLNYFTCTCSPGFTGQLCQINIDECAISHRCHNGGSCVDGLNSYSCSCVPGYTGNMCEADVNECDSSPCVNGGKCLNQLNSFACQCTQSFTGILCQKGVWQSWSQWSGCSATCGHGYKLRTRQCSTSVAPCVGDSNAYQLCTLAACPNANEADDLEGAIITLPQSSLLNAIVNKDQLVKTVVAAVNFYCTNNAYDFCSSFELQSKMQSMKPEPSMISLEYITLEYYLTESSDINSKIQVIVTVAVKEIEDLCYIPNDMGNVPDRVFLKDVIINAALNGYITHIEKNVDITVTRVQTTAEALQQSNTEGEAESTKVPIIVASTIFGTVALIIVICVAKGMFKSKFSKPGAKRTISKISVNPIIGPDSRPTTPASIFTASHVHVHGDRPFSGMSCKSGWSSRPLSAISAMSGRPRSASRPLSSSSAVRFKEARPHSGASAKSTVSVIPPTNCSSINSVMNPKVTSAYEGLIKHKSNFDDRRIPGQPTKSFSFNVRDLKLPKHPGEHFKTAKLLLPKQPSLEIECMPSAVGE